MSDDELTEEIAQMLVRIEANYQRETSGPGSRFEGQRLEVAQARAVIRRVRERDESLLGPRVERLEIPDGPWKPSPSSMLSVSRNGRRVRLEMDIVHGGAVNLAIGDAWKLACVIAALIYEADAEPDPDKVEELAMLMVEGTGAMGIAGAKPLARKILRAGYRREAAQ